MLADCVGVVPSRGRLRGSQPRPVELLLWPLVPVRGSVPARAAGPKGTYRSQPVFACRDGRQASRKTSEARQKLSRPRSPPPLPLVILSGYQGPLRDGLLKSFVRTLRLGPERVRNLLPRAPIRSSGLYSLLELLLDPQLPDPDVGDFLKPRDLPRALHVLWRIDELGHPGSLTTRLRATTDGRIALQIARLLPTRPLEGHRIAQSDRTSTLLARQIGPVLVGPISHGISY
jgi:hypothetical protein